MLAYWSATWSLPTSLGRFGRPIPRTVPVMMHYKIWDRAICTMSLSMLLAYRFRAGRGRWKWNGSHILCSSPRRSSSCHWGWSDQWHVPSWGSSRRDGLFVCLHARYWHWWYQSYHYFNKPLISQSKHIDQFASALYELFLLEHPSQVAVLWCGCRERKDAGQCQQLDDIALEEIVFLVSHTVQTFR